MMWLFIAPNILIAQEQQAALPETNIKSKDITSPTSNKSIKRLFINSNPIGAEVIIDKKKEGVTPCLLSLSKGYHKIELHKENYLGPKKYIFIGGTVGALVDTLSYVLNKTIPIYIESDIKNLDLLIKNNEDTVFLSKIPAQLDLPLGKYTIALYNSKRRCFKGSFKHNGQGKVKIPCYSKGTFELFAIDYFFTKPLLKNHDNNNLYHLLATGQFGRFTLLPGLSSSIAKASIFQLDKHYKDTETTIISPFDTVQLKYPNHIPALSILFLNAEFRIGLPITRLLDIAVLGSYTYYPNITKSGAFHHVSGQDIFVGIELASRIGICNVNIKIGSKRLSNIYYNFYTKNTRDISLHIGRDYSEHYYKVPAKLEQLVVSIGVFFGQGKGYSNNMIRVLRKPLLTNY